MADPMQDGLAATVAELTARVSRLERVLGVGAAQARESEPGQSARSVVEVPPRPVETAAPVAPDVAPARVPVLVPPARREPLSIERLERAIGARWYAAAGAVVVVIALGLFLKFAYDQGWLRVPPALRCAGGGLFGIVLVAVGEVLRRRIGALAGAGLYAAGIGCVYVSAYSAYRLHVIESHGAAFALLGGVAIAGVLLASRVRLALVAAASLIAGYVTPFLFAGAPPQPLVLPSYLLMLLAVGLTLSIRLRGPFEALRSLCWLGTVLLGGFWVLGSGRDNPGFGLFFLSAVWAAVHGELFVAASRGFSTQAGADSVLRLVSGTPLREVGRAARGRLRPCLSSFCTTAWGVSLGVFVTRGWVNPPDWLAPAGATLATGALAGIMAGGVPVLLGSPRNDRERLGACLLAQKAGLALITITAAATGWVESFTYLALGLGVMIARRWLRMPAFTAFGLLSLAIGTARVVLYDSWAMGLAAGGAERLGLMFTWWMLLSAVCSAAWFAAAALILPPAGERRWLATARTCAALGVAMLLASAVHDDAKPGSICVAWALLSAGLCAARELRPALLLDALGLCGLVLSVGAWAEAYPPADWDLSRAWPLLYPGFVIAGALGAGILGAAAWLARNPLVPRDVAGMVRGVTGAGAGVLLFITTSLEVARVAAMATSDPMTRGAAVSVWWGLVAFGLIGAGFALARRVTPGPTGSVLRWVGLALLATAAAKGLLVDIRGVDPLWRIGAVFVLGLLMLGVHLIYSRIGARVAAPGPGTVP